jgi:hypothetical protein
MRHTPQFLGVLLAITVLAGAAEPELGFAAVVHPSNREHDLHWRDLISLFEGVDREWPNSVPVVLVERNTGSAPYRYLMAHLLNTTSMGYKRRLQNIEYNGGAPVSIKILNSDEAACQFVFNVPSAIALIERKSLSSTACAPVQVVRVDGKLPGEEGYRLK